MLVLLVSVAVAVLLLTTPALAFTDVPTSQPYHVLIVNSLPVTNQLRPTRMTPPARSPELGVACPRIPYLLSEPSAILGTMRYETEIW